MSTLKVNTIQNSSGVEQYLAKAWVNFNGTGTVAIRASGNVSSISDLGVGDYQVNFTTAMPDANYGFSISGRHGSNGTQITYPGLSSADPTASAIRVIQQASAGGGGGSADVAFMSVTIFR